MTSRQAVIQHGSSMPSVMEVPGTLPTDQWSTISQSHRAPARPLSVSVHGHTEALLPPAYSFPSDGMSPKALEISIAKRHSYRRTRKKVCYLALTAVLLAIIVATAVCVPLIVVRNDDESAAKDDLPVLTFVPPKPPPTVLRIQNANSNWAWMEDIVSAFNAAHANETTQCTLLLVVEQGASGLHPHAAPLGIHASVYETISRFNATYKPVIYAPTKLQWVRPR